MTARPARSTCCRAHMIVCLLANCSLVHLLPVVSELNLSISLSHSFSAQSALRFVVFLYRVYIAASCHLQWQLVSANRRNASINDSLDLVNALKTHSIAGMRKRGILVPHTLSLNRSYFIGSYPTNESRSGWPSSVSAFASLLKRTGMESVGKLTMTTRHILIVFWLKSGRNIHKGLFLKSYIFNWQCMSEAIQLPFMFFANH